MTKRQCEGYRLGKKADVGAIHGTTPFMIIPPTSLLKIEEALEEKRQKNLARFVDVGINLAEVPQCELDAGGELVSVLLVGYAGSFRCLSVSNGLTQIRNTPSPSSQDRTSS